MNGDTKEFSSSQSFEHFCIREREEINGGVGTNGDEEEDLMTEQTQMKYKNGWDSLVEQHAEEEKRYNMKWVV